MQKLDENLLKRKKKAQLIDTYKNTLSEHYYYISGLL